MSKKTKRTVGWVAFYIFVAAFVVLLLLPFIWQFLTSVKPLNEIAEMPAKWIPSYFHGQFYVNVFTKHPFARYMLNSLIVATSATLLSLLIGASAAYALSRLHFKGRAVLLMVILGVSMFPTIATLSPLYLILKNMNLLNTYQGLILTYIGFSLPMAIWLMTNFFSQIEKGFEEAAAIDGCSHFQTFVKIMLPLIKPATFSVGLLVFINCWNENSTCWNCSFPKQLSAAMGRYGSSFHCLHTATDRTGTYFPEEHCSRSDNWWYERLIFGNYSVEGKII